MGSEKKRAPKASEALMLLDRELHGRGYGIMSPARCAVHDAIAAAERAEAEAWGHESPQRSHDASTCGGETCPDCHAADAHDEAEAEERDGESVEALMRECRELAGYGHITLSLMEHGEWGAQWDNEECGESAGFHHDWNPVAALTALRDKLRAAQKPKPDYAAMSWEELEARLPSHAYIEPCGDDFGHPGYAVRMPGGRPLGPFAATRIDAVRAWLEQHGPAQGGAA